MTMTIREATAAEAPRLTAVINAAYRVEDFFKIGDRIDVAGVLEKMQHGRFLVLQDGDAIAGCVYVEISGRGRVLRRAVDRSFTPEAGPGLSAGRGCGERMP